MTNFTRKARADSQIAIGKSKIAIANRGREGPLDFRSSNKDRLSMTRSGVNNLVGGTIEKNRAAKGLSKLKPRTERQVAKKRLPAISRPPDKKLASAKKKRPK